MALGPRDTRQLVLLTGWDADELKNFELRDGTTFAAVVAQMNAAIGALNTELYNHPVWSSAVSYTDQPDLEYRVGSSNGFEDHTEYGRPDPKRADVEGHMLPIKGRDRALGWTWDYLRKARMDQVRADIADAIKDAKDLWRVAILTRALKRTDDSGALLGLGSGGYSPGFATTAASTNVDYTPPSYGGVAFANTHEHYVAISGGAFTAAVFSDAKAELLEHGHNPPFEAWISASDEADVRGLTGFYATNDTLVRYGSLQDTTTFGSEYIEGSYYIGTIHDIKIRVIVGMPQYYALIFKSYGMNSQRNPFRIRLDKGMTRPMVQAFPDPRSGAGAAYPLQYMMLFTEFGVGVADRTVATARYVNNATWADGTPT